MIHANLIFIELLKTESASVHLVEPTLQTLKTLLELYKQSCKNDTEYEQTVHSLLSECLVNIGDMQYVNTTSNYSVTELYIYTETEKAVYAIRKLEITCWQLF